MTEPARKALMPPSTAGPGLARCVPCGYLVLEEFWAEHVRLYHGGREE